METSRTRNRLVAALVSAAALLTFVTPAGAVGTGEEGCTPGYWKTHTENWEEFSPSTRLDQTSTTPRLNVFTFPTELAHFGDDTFIEALNYRGGPGLDGATQILMRAAVAAFLNAAHDDMGYPLQRSDIRRDVNAALATLDRDAILSLAAELDRLNNLGCPLN